MIKLTKAAFLALFGPWITADMLVKSERDDHRYVCKSRIPPIKWRKIRAK